MAKGKKYEDAMKRYDRDQFFTPAEALELVKGLASANFDETVELAVALGIDPRKADQVLREMLKQAPPSFSAATKTFCTEHEQRVATFAARAAGADALLWGRMARGVCYSPAYTIMGGTSNVLRNILGERVLGLPR